MAKLSERRKQLLRENRQLLKEAGFSPAEVDRYKGASRENVLKAIAKRALPERREEKRTARKVKPKTKRYNNNQESRTFLVESTSGTYLRSLEKAVNDTIKDGFNYYMVQITYESQSGQEYISRTTMIPTAGLSFADIMATIEDESENFMEQYEEYIRKVKVELIFWKAKRSK
jgi:hypothetical protein